jgi:serine/threonine protein kinase
VRQLGRGAYGQVWLARDQELGRDVAVKEITAQLVDPVALRRFQREARLCARLRHPHVTRVLDFGLSSRGEPFMVYEYVAGGSLAEHVLAHGPLPPAEALRCARELADALAYLHEQDILHRDLKPSNVLLRENGEAVLTDFGLVLDPEDPEVLTRTGEVVGTPAYLAPELWRGEPSAPASDQFALGLTLLAASAGLEAMPWSSATELHAFLRSGEGVRVVGTPGVPPGLARTLERTLSFAPGDRFPEVRRLVDHLERLATDPSPPPRTTQAAPLTRRSLAPPARSPTRSGARPRGLVAILGLAGLVAAALVGSLREPRSPGPDATPEAEVGEHLVALEDAIARLRRLLREERDGLVPQREEHVGDRIEELSSPRMPLAVARVLDALAEACDAAPSSPATEGRATEAIADGTRWVIHVASDASLLSHRVLRRAGALLRARPGDVSSAILEQDAGLRARQELMQELRLWVGERLPGSEDRSTAELASVLALAGMAEAEVSSSTLERAAKRLAGEPPRMAVRLADGILAVLEGEPQRSALAHVIPPAALGQATEVLLEAPAAFAPSTRARGLARALHVLARRVADRQEATPSDHSALARLVAALGTPMPEVPPAIRRGWMEGTLRTLRADDTRPGNPACEATLLAGIEALGPG